MDVSARELANYVLYQAGALKAFLDLFGLPLQHIKLHGALYNYMVRREEAFLDLAAAVERAFKDVIFVTLGTARGQRIEKGGRPRGAFASPWRRSRTGHTPMRASCSAASTRGPC